MPRKLTDLEFRRRGEGKGDARKRWKATGRCQSCGRKVRGKGRQCDLCRSKRGNKDDQSDWN